mgnify:CR=1 FL=1
MNHKLWHSIGDFRTRQYLLFLVVFIALITTFVSWSLSSPLGSAPDDAYHAAQIWCADNASDQCEIVSQQGEAFTVRVPYISPNCYWNPSFQNASCISQSENISEQVASFGRSDYPNGMYKVLNLFVSETSFELEKVLRFCSRPCAGKTFPENSNKETSLVIQRNGGDYELH